MASSACDIPQGRGTQDKEEVGRGRRKMNSILDLLSLRIS